MTLMRLIHFFIYLLAIVSLSACVYRMDIDQGNRIEAAKLEQLQTGMTRKQVEFLLGKAAVNDLFNANQAHYIYYLYHGEERQAEQRTMILTYQDDVLVTIEGAL